ncbi:MAG: hypothetical protein AB1861_16160, partial [Cyanobacteriota bacterium]
MSTQNQKHSIKKLVSLMSVAGASVFLSFPALALINSTSSTRNQQLLAQSTPGGTQTNPSGTGTNQQTPAGTGTGTNQQTP